MANRSDLEGGDGQSGAARASLTQDDVHALVHRVLLPPGRVVTLDVRGDRPIHVRRGHTE